MSKKRSNLPQKPAPNNQPQVVAQQTSQFYSSPYPLPQVVEAYERLAPGSAREIIEISRRAVESNIQLNDLAVRAAIDHERRSLLTIQIVLGITIPGGFALALINKDPASYGILIGQLATLVGAFFYSKKKQI